MSEGYCFYVMELIDGVGIEVLRGTADSLSLKRVPGARWIERCGQRQSMPTDTRQRRSRC